MIWITSRKWMTCYFLDDIAVECIDPSLESSKQGKDAIPFPLEKLRINAYGGIKLSKYNVHVDMVKIAEMPPSIKGAFAPRLGGDELYESSIWTIRISA
jgi:hypothetical protein